jgi:N6-adenosine-specific RNA methylase IME4
MGNIFLALSKDWGWKGKIILKKGGIPMNDKYEIAYADPAWPYDNPKGNRPELGGCPYPCMTMDEIKALPIHKITAPDSVLFLWATMPKLPEAIEVMTAWGFTYTTCAFVWVKTNPKSGGIYSGLGHWCCGNAELVLLGKRGHPQRINKCIKQIVMAPVGRHSSKPDEIRERIVHLLGDKPRIELFARHRYEGWDCLGNEIDGKDIRQALAELIARNQPTVEFFSRREPA